MYQIALKKLLRRSEGGLDEFRCWGSKNPSEKPVETLFGILWRIIEVSSFNWEGNSNEHRFLYFEKNCRLTKLLLSEKNMKTA